MVRHRGAGMTGATVKFAGYWNDPTQADQARKQIALTSRWAFVKGAAAACIALANIDARGFDGLGLPNPIFAYEFGDISPEQQAGFAREYDFEGTVFDHAQQIPERLRALDEAHLQLFFLWLTVSNGQIKYEPRDGSRNRSAARAWNRRMGRGAGGWRRSRRAHDAGGRSNF